MAAVAALVALIAASFAELDPGTGATAMRCKSNELHVVFEGGHRCLTLVQRRTVFVALVRLRDAGTGGDDSYRLIARRFHLPIAAVRLIAAEGTRRGLPPAPSLPVGVPVTSEGGPEGGTDLEAGVACSLTEKGLAVATLRWRTAGQPGSAQRVVVSIYFRGLEQGRLEASGPLRPDRVSFEWFRVHGRAVHYWRVLTRHGNTWAASPTSTFTGPTCTSGP